MSTDSGMATIGFVLFLSGLATSGWVASAMGWRRMLRVDAPPSHPSVPRLVLAGPYRFVRHPRALAVVLLTLGAGFAQWAPFWLSGIVIVAATLVAIRQDRQLRDRFGETYRRYQRAVPFLVPRLFRRG